MQALPYVEGDEGEAARCLFLKGRALGALGRTAEAQEVLREAAAMFGRSGARQQQAACYRELGELHLARDEVPEAVEALRAGLTALDPRRSRA
jgi:tetratricopeptide (TPR) repeat protein